MKVNIRLYCKFILIAMVAFMTMLAVACSRSPVQTELSTKAEPARLPPAQVSDTKQVIKTGFIEKSRNIPVNSEFSGKISELYVQQGQTVTTGQPLFKLEPNAGKQTSAIGDQKAYDDALQEYNRFKNLYEIGGISRRQLEAAAANLEAAQSNRKAIPGTGLSREPVVIKAPMAGVVTELMLALGAVMQENQQALVLGSSQPFHAVILLEQKELYLFPLGAIINMEISGQTMTGKVAAIYPEVQGQAVPVFRCQITLTNSQASLMTEGLEVKVLRGENK